MLLQEEMRRVLDFLEWAAKRWDLRAGARSEEGLELKEGLDAYALQQAALQRSLAASFKGLWATPLENIDNLLETLHVPTPDEDDEDSDTEESPIEAT